jgi:hypothetical protein
VLVGVEAGASVVDSGGCIVVEAWRLRVLIGALVTVNELGVRWGAKGHSIIGVVGDVLRENREKRCGVALACPWLTPGGTEPA